MGMIGRNSRPFARSNVGKRRAEESFFGAVGFTLIELLITLLITGVLAGMAAPSLSAVMRDSRVGTSTSDFLSALFVARSEAAKRGRRVTICPSGEGDLCAADLGWHAGWIVFDDANGNATREPDEEVVSVGPPRPKGLLIKTGGSMRHYISFVPTGATRLVNGGYQMDTISFCQEGVGRQIVINATGRPRVVKRAVCAP